ncbi:MAG: hypothetical protein ACI4E1_08705 [Lachnospira sp.]
MDEEEPLALFPVKEAERRVSSIHLGSLKSVALQDFIDVHLESMKGFYKRKFNSEEYLNDFRVLKEYRDVFLDYIKLEEIAVLP